MLRNFNGSAAFSAAILLLGVAAVIVGSGYGLSTAEGTVGDGLMPVSAGAVMIVFAIVDLVNLGSGRHRKEPSLVAESAASDAEAPGRDRLGADSEDAADTDITGRDARQRRNAMLAVMLTVALTVIVVPYLGFLLSFTAMLLVITLLIERQRVLSALLVTAGSLLVIYLIFVVLLGIPLPTGFLGV